MKLKPYLDRIHYTGPLDPTLDVLNAIHAAHLRAISYENLDIHLGVEVSLDFTQIVDKIVHRQRGGWCFEMNSLLAWALKEIGFNVTLLGAAVDRQKRGNITHLDHLILQVDLDQPYLADVGFGNGFLHPIPLAEGTYTEEYIEHELKIADGYWCYKNLNDNFGYDFTKQPRTIDEFADQCHRLQTSPNSGFVKATVCQRFIDNTHISLRAVVLKEIAESGITTREIDSQTEYSDLLTDTFGLALDPTQLDTLWYKVQAQHKKWVAAGRP